MHKFLVTSVKEILATKTIIKLVLKMFDNFLEWIGLPKHLHKDYPPKKMCSILTQFAKEVEDAKAQLKLDKEREIREKRKKLRRHTTLSTAPNFIPEKQPPLRFIHDYILQILFLLI